MNISLLGGEEYPEYAEYQDRYQGRYPEYQDTYTGKYGDDQAYRNQRKTVEMNGVMVEEKDYKDDFTTGVSQRWNNFNYAAR